MKGIRKYNQTTYGSPENNRRRFVSPPSYEAPEAKTPDFGLPGQITGDGRQSTTPPRDIVYGQTLPTPAEAAGTSPNPLAGQYQPNPTPMQGAGDNPGTGAVMPKSQVQGDPAQVYGVRQPSAIDHAISEPTSAEAILTTANQEEGGPGSGRRPLPPYGDIWEHPRHSSMEVFDRPELNSVLRNPRKEEDVLHRVDALVNQERREWNYDALTQAKSYLIAKYGMPGRSGVYPRQQVGEAHRQLTSRGYRVFEQTNNSREQQNYTNYRSQEGQVLIGHVSGVINHVSGRPYKQKAVGESVQHPGAYDSFKGPQWVDQTNVDPRQSSGSVGQSQPMPQEEGGPGSGRHPEGGANVGADMNETHNRLLSSGWK